MKRKSSHLPILQLQCLHHYRERSKLVNLILISERMVFRPHWPTLLNIFSLPMCLLTQIPCSFRHVWAFRQVILIIDIRNHKTLLIHLYHCLFILVTLEPQLSFKTAWLQSLILRFSSTKYLSIPAWRFSGQNNC